MSKIAPTQQKLKDEQARLQSIEARYRELRAAIEQAEAEVAELEAAIRRPPDQDTRATLRALALGSAPLENIEAQDALGEERREALRRRCDQARQRCGILKAALQENALEQNVVRTAVSQAEGAHLAFLIDRVFAGDVMRECRRQLIDLFGAARAAGGGGRNWQDWVAFAMSNLAEPTDDEFDAAFGRFAGEFRQ